jgi:hypothetical protein
VPSSCFTSRLKSARTVPIPSTPDLWIKPLGALVKTGPAIVLMLVTLAVLKNR